MQIGAYSFGDTPRNPNGSLRDTAQGIANLFEAIVHADRVGLDYFGIGEHHTTDMPASSPGAMVAAAAGATTNIILGSAVSVLSTDDPVRVFQQFATADAISGGGRVEITAGRGSSTESFPLFGYSLADYDELYAEKLDLLLRLNSGERVTWSGTFRPDLNDELVVPRPVHGSLPIWLGTGGSTASTVRAGSLGLPISYGIIGGYPHRFGRLADLYRAAAAQAGHSGPNIRVSVAALGFVAQNTADARELWYEQWSRLMVRMGELRGWGAPQRDHYDLQAAAPGAFFVGNPDDVAERIVQLHTHMGHSRHFLQMDLGGLPQEHYLSAIELLATEVAPRVRRALDR